MDSVRGYISAIASWKTLALLLALLNIKNIPLSWHIRLFYAFLSNWRWNFSYPVFPPGKALVDANGKPTHPVFCMYGITSRTPLSESDYNLHKSNSTYFSDMDVSRTTLAVRLYTPAIYMVSKDVDRELLSGKGNGMASNAHKSIYVAVGSVYCAFKREVKPFELYEVLSKVIAWDQKWLYIMTFFLRPGRKGTKQTLLASAVTKYVVKKGRLTVPPARVLRRNGLLPPLPEGMTDESLSAERLVEEEEDSSLQTVLSEDTDKSAALAQRKSANVEGYNGSDWSYDMVERERRRGLKVVEGYANLDAKVFAEWEG